MAVFRVEKTRDYTVMSNHHLRNKELSLKAKGLLSLMLSLPEDWDYTIKGLSYICKDGVDSICTTVKELEQAGYIQRRRIRNAKGRLEEMEYIIREKPVLPEEQQDGNPVQEKPVLASPKQENPVLENPVQLNTKESNKEKSNTDLSSTHSFCLSQGGENPRVDTESAADGLTDRTKDIETENDHVSPVRYVSSSGEQKRYPFSAFRASILSHLPRFLPQSKEQKCLSIQMPKTAF